MRPISRLTLTRAAACGVRWLAVAVVGLGVGLSTPKAHAQINALAEQIADTRVDTEDNNFRLRIGEITAEQHRARAAAIQNEVRLIDTLLSPLPRALQNETRQRAESVFQTRIVPLREQWRLQELDKQARDREADAARRAELATDAATAGRLQAQRVIAGERAQRGELSAADLKRLDTDAEQQVLLLQRKYDAFGQNWGRLFTQTVARETTAATTALRLEARLADTTSELGRDAHQAADVTLAMQRNQLFRAQQAITAADEQSRNTPLQAELAALQAKYRSGATATDFNDRVTRLVQAGAAAQRPEWEREAVAARESAAAARAATARAAADRAAAERAATTRVGTQPATATAPPPPPPPPPTSANAPTATTFVPPPPPPSPQAPLLDLLGRLWPALLAILALAVGGAAFVAYRGRITAREPAYADARNAYSPPSDDAPQPSRARPAPPTPAVSDDWPLKERLLAEERDKYRARYSDGVDDLTRATLALEAMAPLVAAIQTNLKRLSKSLHTRLRAEIKRQHGNLFRLLLNGVIWLPVFRLFKRSGWLLRAALLYGVYWVVTRIAALIVVNGEIGSAIAIYLLTVIVFFAVEWYLQRRIPLARLNKSLDELKNLKVAYVYDGQLPDSGSGTPTYHAVRVTATSKPPQGESFTVNAAAGVTPGAFLFGVGSLATYRLEQDGKLVALSADTSSDLMREYGGLVTDALGTQAAFAAATLPSLADFGRALQRKRELADDVPRLEKLIGDVDRLAAVWRNTYVSDEVFEFLFRSIGMFNMRDPATPHGILLYGYQGSGKKHLARKIAESVGAKFEQVNPSSLASTEGIAKVWEKARSAGGQPVVLFIPNADADAVFGRTTQRLREHTLEWIAEWEKHDPSKSRIWVVLTAKSDQAIDEAILDQVGQDAKIEITPPDTQGRAQILRIACAEHRLPDGVPESAINLSTGANVQELIRIVKAVKRASTPHVPTDSHWSNAVRAVRGSAAKFKDETKTWERLVLPPSIKERLQVACKILQNADEYLKRGAEIPTILLYGPPGTGKTEVARTIANECGANFMDAKLADVKGNHVGDSVQKIREIFVNARAMAPTVLFIDELDGAVAKRDSEESDKAQQEIVNQMLAEMDGVGNPDRPVFVLGATNYRDKIDRAILSRFSDHIEIPPPDEAGRREIVRRALERKTLDPALDLDSAAALIARDTPGRSGRDLVKLVDRAVRRAARLADAAHSMQLTREHLVEELAELKRDMADGAEAGTWDTLVVGDRTLEQLKQICEALRGAELRMQQGFDPPRGAVLFGPPGTGKTQIARTLANESGVQCLLKGQSDIKSGTIGGAGRRLKQIFDEARSMAPCILFIDELDACASTRGGGENAVVNDEIVTELLTQMDGARKGRPVFVLGATNYLERIDPAVRSRFNYEIELPYPTQAQRERLFAIFLGKYRNVDFDVPTMAAELATLADQRGGRDIRNLVNLAAQTAAQRADRAGTPDRIVLTRDDLLQQLKPKGEPVSDETLQKIWSGIVLEPTIKQTLLDRIRMFNSGDKASPKGLLLYGPPGTGKTEIARLLAQSMNCAFLEHGPATLKGEHVGKSGKLVKDVWDKARASGRAVIFVDECDAVFARRDSVRTDEGIQELVGAFLPLWDGVGSSGQFLVVGATNHRDRLDGAILSRFGTPIEIGLPGAPQRLEILGLELKKLGRDAAVPDFIAGATAGFSGRKLADLARTVCTAAASRGGVLSEDLWREATGRATKASSDAVDARASWESLILTEPTVTRLKRICQMLRHAEILEQQGVDVPRAALLYGPPGTGKTQIARTLAVESGVAFVSAALSDVKAGHVGQSGQFVRELFQRARSSAPCILFIDELDAGAADRAGEKSDQFTNDIVTELLTQMDGVIKTTGHVFVLAATNYPDLLDRAVLSRFEDRIEIPNPGPDERRRMIKAFIGKRRVDFDVGTAAGELAARCDGLSGRDISMLVRKASQRAAERAMDAGRPAEIVMTLQDLMGGP